MERDIVQFVPFRDYKSDAIQLASQTLDEIPRQLTSYMESKGIKPTKQDLVNVQNANFFEAQKMQFVTAMMNAGYPQPRIEEFLAKGLPENSSDLFKIQVDNPLFRNPLFELNASLK